MLELVRCLVTTREVPRRPAYTWERRATMWIDAECKVVDDPDKGERLFRERRG
ncbi:hypothetical protein ACU635_36535 [[Actinomadura] parvosata]|uniref:hypothetical protein n=1 Tax=[Actinomadura] parvosata TaxID=1955412 RepID=UPI00406D48C0